MSEARSNARRAVSGQPDTQPRFYTVSEYAELTRFCARTIRNKIHRGEIPAANIHGRLRIPARALPAPTNEGAASASPAGDA